MEWIDEAMYVGQLTEDDSGADARKGLSGRHANAQGAGRIVFTRLA